MLITFLVPLFVETTVCAGPILLAGHDPDDHQEGTTYTPLYQNMLNNVTNGGSGILALGVKDEDSPTNRAGNFITTIAAGLSPAQTVTFQSGANIDTVVFTSYAIIHIPTNIGDCPSASCGGLSEADNNKIVARVADFTTFVNAGGGVAVLSQNHLTKPWQMLVGSCGETFSFLSASSGGLFPGGDSSAVPAGADLFYDITPTAEGQSLGITNTNLDGFITCGPPNADCPSYTCNSCFHDVFTAYPSYFHLLATCTTDSIPGANFNGQAVIIGGVNTGICPSNSGDWAWTHRP